MIVRRSDLLHLLCALVLAPLCHTQQAPTPPVDSSDARKLLELSQAAVQAKQWAKEARESVAAADHALHWLRPVLAEHQLATESFEAGRRIEACQWIEKWGQDAEEWVWWFDARKFLESGTSVLDIRNREPWVVASESSLKDMMKSTDDQAVMSLVTGDALQELSKSLRELQEQLLGDDSYRDHYRPWVKVCSQQTAPQSLRSTLQATQGWLDAEMESAKFASLLREESQAATTNVLRKSEAESMLAQAKEALPRLKQRAVETAQWAKEAREGNDWDKIRVADDAKRMAASDLARCEENKEESTAKIAEYAKQAKKHDAQLKQLTDSVSASETAAKTALAGAARAWSQMTAELASTTKQFEEQSKKGHDDAELLDQAAARWLQEAKDLARAKGR